ncbi:MAG TPA: RNA methyltransferase, partial [Candidatus Binatia bacterium]|nr:RNA methyltransferase [Candidatus Binatia bacterium]
MLVRIADAADPRLAVYRDLAHGASARRDGLFVAEGRLLVGRLLRDARFRTRSVLVTRAGLAAL